MTRNWKVNVTGLIEIKRQPKENNKLDRLCTQIKNKRTCRRYHEVKVYQKFKKIS